MSNRRREISPPRGGGIGGISTNGGIIGSSKLRMDREPVVTRISGNLRFINKFKTILDDDLFFDMSYLY